MGVGPIFTSSISARLKSYSVVTTVLVAFCSIASFQTAHAITVLSDANSLTVDADGDGVADRFDNAPGVSNPSQADADGDGIGDAIDPNPAVSDSPFPSAALSVSPQPVGIVGDPLTILFTIAEAPVGGHGAVWFDFDGNGLTDGFWLGPLSVGPAHTAVVDPLLFMSPSWDLTTPGSYQVDMRVVGPGLGLGITRVTVAVEASQVPEPSPLALFGLGLAGLGFARRKRAT